jgi:hypothetical protein
MKRVQNLLKSTMTAKMQCLAQQNESPARKFYRLQPFLIFFRENSTGKFFHLRKKRNFTDQFKNQKSLF